MLDFIIKLFVFKDWVNWWLELLFMDELIIIGRCLVL